MTSNQFAAHVATLIMEGGQVSASSGKAKPNRPRLKVACTELVVAERLVRHFGGRIGWNSPGRPAYLWLAQGPIAVAALEVALPYLADPVRERAEYIVQRAAARRSA